MKILVERHVNIPSSLLGNQTCPGCFSELLVEEGDIISATFAPLEWKYKDDGKGNVETYDNYDYDNLYQSETFTCPVCHNYIVKRFDEKARNYVLISLLDKRVNEELLK